MSFDLGRFFEAIFRPAKGEVVTVMYDVPRGTITDSPDWLAPALLCQQP